MAFIWYNVVIWCVPCLASQLGVFLGAFGLVHVLLMCLSWCVYITRHLKMLFSILYVWMTAMANYFWRWWRGDLYSICTKGWRCWYSDWCTYSWCNLDVWSTILDDPLITILTIYTGGDVYYLDGCYLDWRSRCIADPPLGNLTPE